MSIIVHANAKINLSLDITGIRNDGYHLLYSVMQSVDLYDKITVLRSDKIEVMSFIRGEINTAYKAAYEFFKYTEINGGAKIFVKKNIPLKSGLGGGSADAAAVITALDILYKTNLTDSERCEIAIKIGADVPFCIIGGTVLVEGIGEKTTKLPDISDVYFVIVKRGKKPSTREMYGRYDLQKNIIHPESEKIIEAINNQNILKNAQILKNVFEILWEEKIADIKACMNKNGSKASLITGSGPSVFGIFTNENAAKACADELKIIAKHVYICKNAKSGVEII